MRTASTLLKTCIIVSVLLVLVPAAVGIASVEAGPTSPFGASFPANQLLTAGKPPGKSVAETVLSSGIPSIAAEAPGRLSQRPVPVNPETVAPLTVTAPQVPARVDARPPGAKAPEEAAADTLKVLGIPLRQPLPLFGHDFFSRRAATAPEALNVTIDPDYRLGPGDALVIHAWSQLTDKTLPAEVDTQGRLAIPGLGELLVMGVRYGELDSLLSARFSEALKDVQVSTSLVRLRTFQVLVSGEVAVPGAHAVNALATVLTALLASGGPTERGSLRKVSLVRHGRTTATIDYYDLLIQGKQAADPRLEPGDLVFVPVVGDLAAISGMVRRPAIYELKPGESLASLITCAGGLASSARTGLIQVQRNLDGARRQLVDLRGAPGEWKELASRFKLQDGDAVEVPEMSARIENTVLLQGNVERPGSYQWKKGMRVSELVRLGQKLLPGTFMGRAELLRTRTKPEDLFYNEPLKVETIRELLSVDLRAALAGSRASDLELQPLDELTILSLRNVRPAPMVRIVGEVFRPGSYELAAGMRLRDLIFRAGNLTADAHLARGEVTRHKPGGGQETLPVDLGKAMEGLDSANLPLENFDVVSVQSNPDLLREIAVTVRGEVRHPGVYLFRPGEKVSDLLSRAGGFTTQAFPEGSIFTRRAVQSRQEAQKARFVAEQGKLLAAERAESARMPKEAKPLVDPASTLDDVEKMLQRLAAAPASGRVSLKLGEPRQLSGTADDLVLEDNDELEVPARPSEITVAGEVYTEGSFVFEEGRNVAHYLGKAGGMTRRALGSDVFILRADGTTVSAAQLRSRQGGWDGRHLGMSSDRRHLLAAAVQRGDSIFVPPDFRIKRDEAGEMVDRIFKVAMSVGTLSAIFR